MKKRHLTSWYELLEEAMERDGENFVKRKCTLSEKELKVKFDNDYGETKGDSFTAWGEHWVYFPLQYDGMEYIGHAPRHPCEIAMDHQRINTAELISMEE